MSDAPIQIQNLGLSLTVAAVDKIVKEVPDPTVQMGILMLAQAKAFGRVMKKIGVTDRAGKRRLLALAVRDFEKKIQQFGFSDSHNAVNANPNDGTPKAL